MTRQQRDVFDEVAGAYDRARPDYPPELADDVLAFAHLGEGERILEIGPGTGKATVRFAGRGHPLLCVEPGAKLAEVLCANTGGREVEVLLGRFEDAAFEPGGFGLVIAGQSFHWVDPEVAYLRCVEALRPGGTLALFWNRPRRGETECNRVD